MSFPPKVPLTSALPVITAVLPYKRTFISESSSEASLLWPFLNASTICDLSDIRPYTLVDECVVVGRLLCERCRIASNHRGRALGFEFLQVFVHIGGPRQAEQSGERQNGCDYEPSPSAVHGISSLLIAQMPRKLCLG